MTIYEIDELIESCIDPETGEVDAETLMALQMARDEKIENVALYIKDLEAQIKALKAEEDALKARRDRKTDTIDRLTEWLKMALNGQRFETARCDVRFRRSTAVKVLDVGAIPREYMRYKPAPDPEPDKAKIKKALLEGAKIAGVGLTEGLSCTVK